MSFWGKDTNHLADKTKIIVRGSFCKFYLADKNIHVPKEKPFLFLPAFEGTFVLIISGGTNTVTSRRKPGEKAGFSSGITQL